jgi:hypothetical protein
VLLCSIFREQRIKCKKKRYRRLWMTHPITNKQDNKYGLGEYISLGFLLAVVILLIYFSQTTPGRPEIGQLAETKDPAYIAVSEEAYGEFAVYVTQENDGASQSLLDSGEVRLLPAGFPLTYLGIESIGSGLAKVKIGTSGAVVFTDWANLQEYVEKENNKTAFSDGSSNQEMEDNSYFKVGDKVSSNTELWVASTLSNWEKIKDTISVSTGNEEMEKNHEIIKFPEDYAEVTGVLDRSQLFGVIQVRIDNREWYVNSSYLREYSEEAYKQKKEEAAKKKAKEEMEKNKNTAQRDNTELISIEDIANQIEYEDTLTAQEESYHVYVYKDEADKKYRLGFQRGGEPEFEVAYKFEAATFSDMYVLNGKEDILTLVSPDDHAGTKVQHFFIKNGNLTLIKDTDEYHVFPQTNYKYSKDGDFYQTAFHAHGIGGWYFINLKLNKEKERFDVEEIVFEGYPSPEDKTGKDFLDRWNSDEAFVLTRDMY